MNLPLSVVVATYQRPDRLAHLLGQLARQTLSPELFEVVVVDDGSVPPTSERLGHTAYPFELRLEQQPNRGAAAARHRGVLAARGEVLVIIDDDMQVEPDFLERHLRRHADGARRVVLGRIARDPSVEMPLFERWHAAKIDQLAARFERGEAPDGLALYTGNVSLRRADYLAVGGFDPSFGHSEDVELGLRLQESGVRFEFAPEAVTLHGSDHTSLERWRARAAKYGAYALRLARKHPEAAGANPWRFLFELNPASRPLMAATVLVPAISEPLAGAAYRAGEVLGARGYERAALAAANVAFGLDYFRGLRGEAGPLPRALGGILAYAAVRLLGAGRGSLLVRALRELRADQAAMRRYEQKYGHANASTGNLAQDLVQKIGLQELAAYRVMRALRDAHLTLAAKVVSRAIRHVFGSDLHWDAELSPGVMLVHGFGLAISHSARVGPGCILFQGVTLGVGTDPVSRESGAPLLEANVHVGPGATLLGPIVVGAGSKVMAGVVLNHSVPAGSVVLAPEPTVRKRRRAEPRLASG